MKFGPCPKCGGGDFYLPKIKPISIVPKDKYCSKCGASLYSKCRSCNGTGRIGGGLIGISRDRYCSECGRKLDDTCSSCGGEGEVYDSSHYLHCPKRFGL